VAYLVARPQTAIDVRELRDLLRSRLPEYMVPSAFVVLDTMPLNPSGKVDRKALPSPDATALSNREFELPQTETEIRVATVWAEVLDLDQVGRLDNFFDIGGHSLKAVQVVSRLRQVLSREVEIRDLFAHPELADLCHTLDTANKAVLQPIKRVPRNNHAPLPAPHLVGPNGSDRPLIAPQDDVAGRYDLQTKKVIE
jgi:syringomycin synthetase protein SyrE